MKKGAYRENENKKIVLPTMGSCATFGLTMLTVVIAYGFDQLSNAVKESK